MIRRNRRLVPLLTVTAVLAVATVYSASAQVSGSAVDDEAGEGADALPTVEVDDYLPTYSLGDQYIELTGGAFRPLAFTPAFGGTSDGASEFGARLTWGGSAGLRWASYLGNHASLGLGFEVSAAASKNMNLLFNIPVTFDFAYVLRSYPWEFPIGVGVGVGFTTFRESLYVGPTGRAAVGIMWNAPNGWAFGGRVGYRLVPELYTTDPLRQDNRLGHFLSLSFLSTYHLP